MGDELNMTSTDYSIALLVFFISYVLFEAPSNMILTRVRPSIYMPVRHRPLPPLYISVSRRVPFPNTLGYRAIPAQPLT